MVLWHLIYHEYMGYNFFTIADVADMLKVSQGAVRNLINNGELKAIQIGGRGLWRIEESAMEEYIKGQYAQSEEKIASGAALVE
ncbi:DNA binding domain, excisionase family [Mobiluncus holmesii]|nr:DNA binding domain, excisionase family [Mobiluncus holmesii]